MNPYTTSQAVAGFCHGSKLIRKSTIISQCSKFEPCQSYHLHTSHPSARATSSCLSVAPGVVSQTTHFTSSPKIWKTASWLSTNSASSPIPRFRKREWTLTRQDRPFQGASQDKSFKIINRAASYSYQTSCELKISVRFSDVEDIKEIVDDLDALDLEDGPD